LLLLLVTLLDQIPVSPSEQPYQRIDIRIFKKKSTQN
jgi:hypothetical protein